jgi:predicted flavoprotein YhiN
MMSKKIPNLFLAGEILDVDGITGGFNFQHAWPSGWIAAKNMH